MGSYMDWEIRDFTEGLIDRSDANVIPVNAAQDCQNVISRVIGRLKIRGGQKKLNSVPLANSRITGLYPYYTESGTKRLVTVCNGKVYYWNAANSSFTQIHTGLTADTDVLFESCANYLVGFNGIDVPFKWDGSNPVSILTNAPAGGKMPVLHKEQLFIQHVGHPSQLWWSDPFAPETWPDINYWSFNDGDGDSITCHKPFLGELIIFKRRSIHNLRGTTLDDFRSDMLNNRVGCVGPRAATVYGTTMYFVADDGLYAFNGVTATNITRPKIPNFWKRINKQYIHKAVVEVWDGLIWVALPEGDSAANNIILICDPEGQKFWPWRGISADCLAIFNDGTTNYFYSGDSAATGFIRQQDVGSDDDGTPIEAYYIGQAHNQGTPDREKKAKKVFMETTKDWDIYSDTGVVADTYEIALSPDVTSYSDGLEAHFWAAKENIGAATLACNGLSAIPVLRHGVPLIAGDINKLDLVHVVYNGGYFYIQEPMKLSVSLDESPEFEDLSYVRTDGISSYYRPPASMRSRKWKYLTPKFYRNALGPCEIRGLLIPIKTKTQPKVRRPRL